MTDTARSALARALDPILYPHMGKPDWDTILDITTQIQNEFESRGWTPPDRKPTIYVFTFHVLTSNDTSFYYDRWDDEAHPYTIHATTQADAIRELVRILGPSIQRRRYKYRLMSTTPAGDKS